MKTEELERLFEKLKSDKKAVLIVAMGVLGMLLVLFSGSDDGTDSTRTEQETAINIYSETELASSVEKLISTIDGAGKTKVMITYECYEETVYIYDKDEETQNDGRNDISNEYIIIDAGDKEDGLKSKILAPKIRGVAIVCEGGNNPKTKEMIITSISALLDISSNKISVAPMAN